MKFQITFLTLCSGLIVDAFPALTIRSVEGLTPDRFKLAIEQVERYRKNRRSLTDTSKPIDVSGEHAFLAPSEKDQRGPCPGLNALANHNYISHDGITSFVEVTAAINQGSSRALDLEVEDTANTSVKCSAWVLTWRSFLASWVPSGLVALFP
jgi:hypothetical protein